MLPRQQQNRPPRQPQSKPPTKQQTKTPKEATEHAAKHATDRQGKQQNKPPRKQQSKLAKETDERDKILHDFLETRRRRRSEVSNTAINLEFDIKNVIPLANDEILLSTRFLSFLKCRC